MTIYSSVKIGVKTLKKMRLTSANDFNYNYYFFKDAAKIDDGIKNLIG